MTPPATGESPYSHVALLRAVNLGPHNKVAMADLVRVFTAAGFAEARTLLQTGNILFRQNRGGDLEARIEAAQQPTCR
ncbi:MAG: DUF1697 domain-containing protein [Vicinamibacterales bacterium]